MKFIFNIQTLDLSCVGDVECIFIKTRPGNDDTLLIDENLDLIQREELRKKFTYKLTTTVE